MEYVQALKAAGQTLLFPELHGWATAFQVVFHKKWTRVMEAALSKQQRIKKSFHSTRKMGNSAMASAGVVDPVRYYIMGHAMTDVNGRHYIECPTDAAMLNALNELPNVTGQLG